MNDDPTGATRRYVVVAQEILAAIGTGRPSPRDRLPNEREMPRWPRSGRRSPAPGGSPAPRRSRR